MPFQPGAKTTPEEAAKNWADGASSKGAKWATNYLRPKVDPFTAGAAAADRWLQAVTEAGAHSFRAGMERAKGRQDAIATWVQTNGAAAFSAGINKGKSKYSSAAATLIPQIQQIAASLPARGNLQQNLARATEMATRLAALKGKHRG